VTRGLRGRIGLRTTSPFTRGDEPQIHLGQVSWLVGSEGARPQRISSLPRLRNEWIPGGCFPLTVAGTTPVFHRTSLGLKWLAPLLYRTPLARVKGETGRSRTPAIPRSCGRREKARRAIDSGTRSSRRPFRSLSVDDPRLENCGYGSRDRSPLDLGLAHPSAKFCRTTNAYDARTRPSWLRPRSQCYEWLASALGARVQSRWRRIRPHPCDSAGWR